MTFKKMQKQDEAAVDGEDDNHTLSASRDAQQLPRGRPSAEYTQLERQPSRTRVMQRQDEEPTGGMTATTMQR
jgi:hypothetical protein